MLVQVNDPEHMNLLGLLIQGFLSQQLAIPRLERKARRMRGNFGVRVADMAITLSFSPEGVVVHKGIAPRVRAMVEGAMNEMIPMVTGGGGMIPAVIAVLEGRITISGNPFALLGLMPLLMGSKKPAPKVLTP
ncbi:MAG: hypothetical protein HY898_21600 [Deltaproteobacteria bacterium]|nr:hypothetical protein [Deltaproteobacteria bacterium]